jgi:serine/threonine protein kinase
VLKQFTQNQDQQKLIQEFQILNKLNHPNIIRYFKSFNENGKVYFVKEYVDNGSLSNLSEAYNSIEKPIEENTLWNIFMQCAAGLDYLHRNNIVHKNLKANNILMNENKVIKIDDILFNQDPKDKSDDIRDLGEVFSQLIPMQFQNQYPQDMIGIVNAMKNNFKNINSTLLLNKIMEQYIKSVAKVSSINAIFRCMSSLQPFPYEMYQKQNSFSEKNTPVAFYYMQCLNTYLNQNGNPKDIIIYYNNFRNLLYKNSQMNNDVEIRPRQVLEFLLERLNRETSSNLRGVSFTTQIMIFEKDKEKALSKFLEFFKNNFDSIISNHFVGYIKTKRICNVCGESNYSFNIHPFIEFDMDMSQIGDNKYPLNLLENWFRAQNNQKKVLSVEHKIVCQSPKCINKVTEHREFKQFYFLPQCFIISLNRGKNYTNTFQPQIPLLLDLQNKIEIKNSPSQFNLVGMVKRFVDDKQEEHFVAIYKDIKQNFWRVSDRDNVQMINDPFSHNKGLIITLFYSAINNKFGQ